MRGIESIVVGAGAAGGLASMILAEAGLKVLLLDAGRSRSFAEAPMTRTLAWLVPRVADPKLAATLPSFVRQWGIGALKALGYIRQPVQSKCFAWLLAPDAYVDDRDFPYTLGENSSFKWFRSHQMGGRMIVPGHGRQYYRLDPKTFDDWPISADELAPWYDLVERQLRDNAPAAAGATATERETLSLLSEIWPAADVTLGSTSPPLNSVSRALATGNVTCVKGAVVRRIEVDAQDRVEGVAYVDLKTGAEHRISAPLVFLCASALESTRILMCSTSKQRPGGIGGDSGVLGRHLMDHVTVTADAEGPGLPAPEPMTPGRCLMFPRLETNAGPASVQIHRWGDPGRSFLNIVSFGEMRPRAANRVALDPHVRDRAGNPVLQIHCAHAGEERSLAAAQAELVQAIAQRMDARVTRISRAAEPPGTAIHECGTARMGSSPANSVLDASNQCWDAKGLYVTDGASFPTQGIQHPTLTIKALTARACAHALKVRSEVSLSSSDAPSAVK